MRHAGLFILYYDNLASMLLALEAGEIDAIPIEFTECRECE